MMISMNFPMSPKLKQSCEDYLQYLQVILKPAMRQLQSDIEAGKVELHQVFGANLFIAHAVDYIQAIRRADGIKESRLALVKQFDSLFSVHGARISNRKIELIDAVNNALKHIRLDPTRYQGLEQHYGPISFQCLVQEGDRVFCILDGYRFDYARVVLLPAYQALVSWVFEDIEDVLEFSRGGEVVGGWSYEEELMASDDPTDAIDQMILACNPPCSDCGEGEEDCCCAEYVFDGENGEFKPLFHTSSVRLKTEQNQLVIGYGCNGSGDNGLQGA